VARSFVHGNETFDSVKGEELIDQLSINMNMNTESQNNTGQHCVGHFKEKAIINCFREINRTRLQ
jgi:hypothetical protein